MNKYDKVYNLLVKQTANSELTLESAEFLNDVAYELYGDEAPTDSELYHEAATRMNDIWNNNSEMGNTNKDLEDSEDEKDKDNKKWSLKKKIAVGLGIASIGAAAATDIATKTSSNKKKRKIERANQHRFVDEGIDRDFKKQEKELRSLKAIGSLSESEYNKRLNALSKKKEDAARKEHASVESLFTGRNQNEIEAEMRANEWKQRIAEEQAEKQKEKEIKSAEDRSKREEKKYEKLYQGYTKKSKKADRLADGLDSSYDQRSSINDSGIKGSIKKSIIGTKININQKRYSRAVKKAIKASNKI